MADHLSRSLSGDFLTPPVPESGEPSALQKQLSAINLDAAQVRGILIRAVHPMENVLNDDGIKGLLAADWLNAQERPVLELLLKHYDSVVQLGGGVAITSTSIDTVGELYGTKAKDEFMADKAKQYARENFDTIDVDNDGLLSPRELSNNREMSTGENGVLADYVLKRQLDIARLSPDASRDIIARNTEMETGVSVDDVNAISATAMTDAAISNLYLQSRVNQPGQGFAQKMLGVWTAGYYDRRHHADVMALLQEVSPMLPTNQKQ